MPTFLRAIVDACALPGRIVGWLILPLIAFVCLGVAAARIGINHIVDWGTELPVLGPALTVNSLLDLQWYIFALLVLFGGVYAFRDRQHVSVDFVSGSFPPRLRLVIEILGDLFLLLPFAAIVTWYGTKFALSAYTSGEGSTYGGLLDRWVIKACIPLAFGLLGLAALARAIGSLRALWHGSALDAQGRPK